MKKSKKKLFLAATSVLVVTVFFIVIFALASKPTKPELVSYQVFQPTDQPLIDSHKKSKLKNNVVDKMKSTTSRKRLPARSFRRGEDPLSIYIDKELGDFGISTSVFAVPENIILGSEYKVVANKLGMNWVQGSKRPENSLTVVMDSKTGKIGYYTGKILIVGKDSSAVKDYLDKSNETYNQISNTFIIELDEFEYALEYANDLRQNIPNASIDVDLNFSRMTAK